jgi:hypothetical protein
MATSEKQKNSEEHGIWDHFIKNPLDGSKQKMLASCKSWKLHFKSDIMGKWAFVSHLKVCRAPSCSQTTQPNLQQMFARNTPLQKDEGNHSCELG